MNGDDSFFRGAPHIPARGVMIDLARVVESPEFVISQLPFYAANRLNRLYLYFENKLRYPSSPDWAHPCAWSMEDLRRVVAAGEDFGIECVPVIASLGHQESLLTHPQYRKLAVPGTMDHLDPENPEALRFFEALLDDLSAVCPARTFHLGGDEAPYLGGDVAAKYRTFFNRMATRLAASGRRIMIWADMPLKHPEIRRGLDRSILPVVWNYGAIAPDFDIPEKLHAEGFDVAVSPAILADEPFFTTPERLQCNLPLLPRREPVAAAIGCLWEPRTQFLDSVKIGISIFARAAWNPYAPLPADPVAAAANRIYADASLADAYRLIHGGELFDLMQATRMRYYHAFEFNRTNPVRRQPPEIADRLRLIRERADAGLSLLKCNRAFQQRHPEDFRLWIAQASMLRLLAGLHERNALTEKDFDFVLNEYRELWNARRNPADSNFAYWFGDVLPFWKQSTRRNKPPRRLLRLQCDKGDAAEWNLLRLRVWFNREMVFFKTVPLWMADRIPVDIAPLDDLPEHIDVEVIYATIPPRSGNWLEMAKPFAVSLDKNGMTTEILPLPALSNANGFHVKPQASRQ